MGQGFGDQMDPWDRSPATPTVPSPRDGEASADFLQDPCRPCQMQKHSSFLVLGTYLLQGEVLEWPET